MAEQNSPERDLAERKCKPCEGGTKPLTEKEIHGFLTRLSGWEYANGEIVKTFAFKNYYQTTAFVNAVIWIAHSQDHHPQIEFGYKTCVVRYSTHAIQGISENDFFSAAKVEVLLK